MQKDEFIMIVPFELWWQNTPIAVEHLLLKISLVYMT